MNIIEGCSHDCRYCYAKANAIRFGRRTAEDWKHEVLRGNMVGKKFGKRKGRIMFPTAHDITMENVSECSVAINAMLDAGNELLIVTKPEYQAMLRLVLNLSRQKNGGRDAILFRFTIGSMDRHTLEFWEPGAPSFAERLFTLMQMYYNGYQTSVSVEPMLDQGIKNIARLFHTVEPYVTDAVWLGRMNQSTARLKLNGHNDQETLLRSSDLHMAHGNGAIRLLAERLGHPNPKLKWKESLKPALGVLLATEAGADQ